MNISKARYEANTRWNKKNLERIYLAVNKDEKDVWKKYAQGLGLSLAAFIKTAVDEKAEREGLQNNPV